MIRLGLTGGIASGKSTVAVLMAEAGAIILDADTIAHDLIAKGETAYDLVLEAFGDKILDSTGQIDRRRLGSIVFGDEQALKRLNAIVHPLVRAKLKAEEDRYRSQEQAVNQNWLLVMMIPLLYESNLAQMVDKSVLVYCPANQQLDRLMARNGFTQVEAEQRLAAQLPIEAKVELADEVIDNSRDREYTRLEVKRVLGELSWDPFVIASSPAV